MKAAYLYKFAGFVEWPAGTFQKPGQPMLIGVTGDDEVASDLEQMAAGRTIDEHPVAVRRITDGASAGGVHVLFIGSRSEARLREILASTPGRILIVTDSPSALRMGSVINFISDGARVRFSVSLDAAQARNLKLSARLLAVAQAVEGRAR